ncbi:hypothetical protein HMPREF1487_09520 [Pseudomonas sp. HPB0071]|uniref:Uncharacterized protein n=1 Tax=Pseudomonas luteola TaxID=47886 RepID=A0A2X2BZ31_PSELU|nr:MULTISPECIES: hypothetical protein [Pseudomonas]ENA27041.1 hypothetical protein HMPREF1487_09520 [Pseudomonas sp. HPB0071]MBA1250134.1 hypothetical protein [Pseudomonas zeshuii]MBH3440884.1 hypothetical protein [Pseudomonas luteola]SPZ00021.1 Uncharacterised protein [Pseudomonas luteola]
MKTEKDLVAALQEIHEERSVGMGSTTIPAWCQFLALTSFTFQSKVIRYGVVAGIILFIAAVLFAAHFGPDASREAVACIGIIGLFLLFLPFIKAGEMKFRLGMLGVLPEFMAVLFAERPFPRWIASKFGKAFS